MKRFVFTFCVISLLASGGLYSQIDHSSLLVTGNVTLPSGDFGENIGENPHITRRAGFDYGSKVGLAQLGYGLGLEMVTPLNFSGLAWILSGRVFVNGNDGAAVENEFSRQLGDDKDIEFHFGNWVNIPIMTGFSYTYNLINGLGLFGIAQAGINVVRPPSREAVVNGVTMEKTSFSFARDFGYEVGAGIEIRDSFTIGFRFINLSTPRFEGTQTLSEKQFPEILSRENALLGEERSISMLLVSVGYRLF